MIYGRRIVKRVEVKEFVHLTEKYTKKDIVCTNHTFFRLNQKQREIYTAEELIKIIKEESPILVGVQENGNYAVFYKYKEKLYKIILGINTRNINIVTFYFINEWQLPKL